MTTISCAKCGAQNLSNARYCSGCGNQLPQVQNEIEVGPSMPANKKQPVKKVNIIGMIVGVVAFWLIYYGVQKVFFGPPSYDKAMVAVASEINKGCPMMIDRSTRLDNAVAMPGNAFQYNYTIVDMSKEEVNLDTVKKYLEPGLIQNVKNSPDLKIQREHKTTLIYNYKDKNGFQIFRLAITPDMY